MFASTSPMVSSHESALLPFRSVNLIGGPRTRRLCALEHRFDARHPKMRWGPASRIRFV